MTVSLTRLLDLADRSARKAARNDFSKLDDIRQEAAIHAWKALSSNPDAPEAYIQKAIINGINNYFHGYITGNGVGSGNGALLCKPGVECPMSDVMEEKVLGYSDDYPCLKEEEGGFAASLIDQLEDPVKRELMYRKYIWGQPDSTIREEMHLTLNQANIHHRWAKAQIRSLVVSTPLV